MGLRWSKLTITFETLSSSFSFNTLTNGSKAHATMLAHQGLITDIDRDSILQGLDEIERKIEGDLFEWRTDRENVHMNIKAALTDLIGEPAKKLHTARSRNDQVATDFRLWCRDAIDTIIVKIKHLQMALVQLAFNNNEDLIVPGYYTHFQRAQPVLLQHVLLTYVEQVYDCSFAPLFQLASMQFQTETSCWSFYTQTPTQPSILSRLGEELVLWASVEFFFFHNTNSFH
ncbi:hypothetical protein HID58_045195 [Brassica napus]|uniref:Fumarate lyase N-terminal domain-containing protein n=1 Tax=Brassica napus TaxID=3708 RepID=A0ABQ8ATP1_BRANA|nr:hypothetical protein HID58_045195 [Brassica napus]